MKFITPEIISGLLIMFGTIIAAIVAALAAGIGVHKINSQKSFELLTKERIKQLNYIRDKISEIRLLTLPEYIQDDKAKSGNKFAYQMLLTKHINDLQKIVTSIEQIERHIFKKLEDLKTCALDYYDSQADANKENLEVEYEFTFALIDIYDWSLWQYIQKLYKGNRKLSKKFDILFLKNYYRAYDIYNSKPLFDLYKKQFEIYKKHIALSRTRKYVIYCKHKIKMWFLEKV